MTTAEKETSHVREWIPVYRALGYSFPEWGTSIPWLWIWAKDTNRTFGLRPSQLISVSTLFALCPVPVIWRAWFPEKGGPGIDCLAAGAALLKACYDAGEIEPPAGINIRGPGRPRKVAA